MTSNQTEEIVREWIDEKGVKRRERTITKVEEKPAVCLDWIQVKSRCKPKARQNREEDLTKTVQKCSIGILQGWYRPSKLSGSFELLENVRTTPRTKEIVKILTNRAMKKLEETGFEALATEVAKNDPVIKLILQMINAGVAAGMRNLHAWHVPRVKEAIKDRLAKKLYEISQGAGVKVPSAVVRMDNTVPVGKVIVTNRDGTWMKSGAEIGLYRFPLVLPQGLLLLETTNPEPHLLLNGKMSPFTVVVNPRDCLKAQGDDDGDIFGVVTDPLLLELFQNKLDNLIFAIEPEGIEKLDSQGKSLMSDSKEGIDYLLKDHRGPVGRCTVWRSRLLAIGDFEAARGVSVAIQECIDQAKRIPAWSDIRNATALIKWVWDETKKAYKFLHKFSKKEVNNGEFPLNTVRDWVNSRLIEAGCTRLTMNDNGEEVIVAGNPLWWRDEQYGMAGKRVDVEKWNIPKDVDERFENLVHYSTRCAYEKWKQIEESFKLPVGEVPMGMLLPLVLKAKGWEWNLLPMDDKKYQVLKTTSGLQAYNSRVATIVNQDNKKSGRQEDGKLGDFVDENFLHKTRALTTAQETFQAELASKLQTGELTIDHIVTLWVHECDVEHGGNVNNAFRLVCWDGSPILEKLGIAEPTKCKFLSRGETDRTEWLVNEAMKASDPFERLKELILKSKRHHEGFVRNGVVVEEPIRDELGVAVQLHQCPDCTGSLQDALVRTLRTNKESRERAYLIGLRSEIASTMNKMDQPQDFGGPI